MIDLMENYGQNRIDSLQKNCKWRNCWGKSNWNCVCARLLYFGAAIFKWNGCHVEDKQTLSTYEVVEDGLEVDQSGIAYQPWQDKTGDKREKSNPASEKLTFWNETVANMHPCYVEDAKANLKKWAQKKLSICAKQPPGECTVPQSKEAPDVRIGCLFACLKGAVLRQSRVYLSTCREKICRMDDLLQELCYTELTVSPIRCTLQMKISLFAGASGNGGKHIHY